MRKFVFATLLVAAFGILCLTTLQAPVAPSNPEMGAARLVSIENLPEISSMCAPEEVSAIATLRAEFESDGVVHAADTVEVTRPPVRVVRDTYPISSSVAVDPVRDEVVLQDTNLFSI
jgi:hypothetical protein